MKLELLEKARIREIKARKMAEQLLESKSMELYNSLRKLSISNKELEASLIREKELGHLKSSFITVASHQFRTPLAVIQSNAELLEMLNSSCEEKNSDKYGVVTGRITAAIAKMTALMDDVLTLGKLTSGNISYHPKEIDLIEFGNELVEQFNLIHKETSALDFVVKGTPYKVFLDVQLLNHSLTNLISNSFKYSKGKRNPELTLCYKSTEMIISVKDYGLGIPEAQLSNLFQPFFRADNVTEIQGTGLGLSIAKEYVEMNKGNISAQSKLGEGSCFKITFKQ